MFISRIALRKYLRQSYGCCSVCPAHSPYCRKGNGFGTHAFHRDQICVLCMSRILIIRRILYLNYKYTPRGQYLSIKTIEKNNIYTVNKKIMQETAAIEGTKKYTKNGIAYNSFLLTNHLIRAIFILYIKTITRNVGRHLIHSFETSGQRVFYLLER